jgi:hypothetical protein
VVRAAPKISKPLINKPPATVSYNACRAGTDLAKTARPVPRRMNATDK